jgi:hypothetical protein
MLKFLYLDHFLKLQIYGDNAILIFYLVLLFLLAFPLPFFDNNQQFEVEFNFLLH